MQENSAAAGFQDMLLLLSIERCKLDRVQVFDLLFQLREPLFKLLKSSRLSRMILLTTAPSCSNAYQH